MNELALEKLTVVAPSRGPAAVRAAVEQLVDYARTCADVEVEVASRLPASGVALCAGKGPAEAAVGARTLRGLGFDRLLGREGYVLAACTTKRRTAIVAAGDGAAGTHHAVLHALRCIRAGTHPATFVLPEPVRTVPAHPLRGMYAHQHWSYRYPYALRTWRTDEWQRYMDILAHGRLNLVQIWSMAGICPAPFSPADRAFLERYPPVIDHARRAHGMQVWIGECANNMAEAGDLPPAADRMYFDVEVLKDPGDRRQVDELLAHRRAFYQLCDNADGYFIIDSDPGGWRGSPTADFVRILAANRRLIDRHTRKGRRAKLVYWMWVGWGTGSREENCREALEHALREVDPPVWFTHSWEAHFALTRGSALRKRVVFLPYGAIEPEPSLPFTTVIPPALREAVATAQREAPFAGMMGNAQTPLVQLPNIWYFANCAWDPEYAKRPKRAVLEDLAVLLCPHAADALVGGWLALDDPRAKGAADAARRLDGLVAQKRLGPPGPLGRLVFPDPDRVVEDLVQLLGIHASAVDFCRGAENPGLRDEAVIPLLEEYILRSIDWRHRTGFKRFGFYGYDFEPVYAAAHGRWREGIPEALVNRLAALIGFRSHPETNDFGLVMQPLCDRRDGKGWRRGRK